jgi:hypothetical protein
MGKLPIGITGMERLVVAADVDRISAFSLKDVKKLSSGKKSDTSGSGLAFVFLFFEVLDRRVPNSRSDPFKIAASVKSSKVQEMHRGGSCQHCNSNNLRWPARAWWVSCSPLSLDQQ